MAQCFAPYALKDNAGFVPCGKCPACTARRVSHWSFRLREEAKRSTSAYFITLTYDTKHVPISAKGFMSINKRDVQLFFKRLRKLHTGGKSIKYFVVGEYGGQTMRPHYHIILFNADVKHVDPAWNLGEVHYGEVTVASCGYTLKYIHKQKKIPLHANDDRVPEFALMSKRLGDNYLTKAMIKFHRRKKLFTVLLRMVRKFQCHGITETKFSVRSNARFLDCLFKRS